MIMHWEIPGCGLRGTGAALFLVLFVLASCGEQSQGKASLAANRTQVQTSASLATQLPTPTSTKMPVESLTKGVASSIETTSRIRTTPTSTPVPPNPTATQPPPTVVATATSRPTTMPRPTASPTPMPVRLHPTATPPASQLSAAAIEGKHLFLTVGCALCHTINGVSNGDQGPNLTHITTQPYDHLPNDPAFLQRWIKNPQAIKPGVLMPDLGLTDQQVRDIVAYLESAQK